MADMLQEKPSLWIRAVEGGTIHIDTTKAISVQKIIKNTGKRDRNKKEYHRGSHTPKRESSLIAQNLILPHGM